VWGGGGLFGVVFFVGGGGFCWWGGGGGGWGVVLFGVGGFWVWGCVGGGCFGLGGGSLVRGLPSNWGLKPSAITKEKEKVNSYRITWEPLNSKVPNPTWGEISGKVSS